MKPHHWIIIALLLVIIAQILFRPKPGIQPDERAYQDTLRFLRRATADLRLSGARIAERSQLRQKSDSVKLSKKDREIQALKVKASQLRVKVVTKIEEDPDLKAFVQTQDEVIEELQIQNDTLRASVSFHIQTQKDLIANHTAEQNIQARIEAEHVKRVEQLEKEVKKSKRANRWLKVGIVVLPVVALLLNP